MAKLEKVREAAEMLINQFGYPPDPIVDLALVGNLRKALAALSGGEL